MNQKVKVKTVHTRKDCRLTLFLLLSELCSSVFHASSPIFSTLASDNNMWCQCEYLKCQMLTFDHNVINYVMSI